MIFVIVLDRLSAIKGRRSEICLSDRLSREEEEEDGHTSLSHFGLFRTLQQFVGR